MTTYAHEITFDDSEMIALTQILENSGHWQARYLLDRLYRGNTIQTSGISYSTPPSPHEPS
jgi:hypothetical protein